MTKKLLALLLAVCLIVGAVPLSASAMEGDVVATLPAQEASTFTPTEDGWYEFRIVDEERHYLYIELSDANGTKPESFTVQDGDLISPAKACATLSFLKANTPYTVKTVLNDEVGSDYHTVTVKKVTPHIHQSADLQCSFDGTYALFQFTPTVSGWYTITPNSQDVHIFWPRVYPDREDRYVIDTEFFQAGKTYYYVCAYSYFTSGYHNESADISNLKVSVKPLVMDSLRLGSSLKYIAREDGYMSSFFDKWLAFTPTTSGNYLFTLIPTYPFDGALGQQSNFYLYCSDSPIPFKSVSSSGPENCSAIFSLSVGQTYFIHSMMMNGTDFTVKMQTAEKYPVNVTVTQANGTYGTELAAPVASQAADGNGTDPSGAFTYKYTGKTAAGKTYNSSEKPTEAGSYTVTATLVSDTHAGSGSANFTVAPKTLTSGMIGAIDPVTYTGSAQTPALTVTDGKALVKNTDYTVEYTNNTNAGTATATITGKGNYTGTASKTFNIQPKDISGLTVTVTGTPEVDQALLATVSGAETSGLTYAWTSDGSSVAGQTKPYLILTSAYENKQIAATVTGSGNYTGTASSQAVTVGASTNESTSVAVPAKPEVSANAGNRQISVSVTVPTEETDKPVCLYEIQLCDSTGTPLNTFYSLTNSYTITGLTNGTAYQVKAIAYNVNGASAQSDTSTATPRAPAPPAPPVPDTPAPTVTTNPDGSKTNTEAAEDGTVTATTTWDDGNKAVAVKTPEGDKTITVTTATGEKVADVNIPATPAAGKEFEDVQTGWYKSAVDTVTGYGLFNGTSATTFSPNDGMTRSMLATVLYNLSGKPEYGTDEKTFTDVASNSWYENPVDWACKMGVTSGTGNGKFSPDKDITREQLVTMLYRYAEKLGAASAKRADISSFADSGSVAGFAQNSMKWAVAQGLISGRSNGGKTLLAPQGTATRAEVAAVLTRFVKYLAK